MDLSMIGIDGVTAVLLTGFVVGIVECIKALFDKDWRSAAIIAGSAVAGGVVSFPLAIPLVTGIVGGFAAAGVVTLAQNLGK